MRNVNASGTSWEAGFVWCCHELKRSRVRTVGRPTGSLRAAGGAPLHASPRPWCRPGRSLRLRPT